MSDLRVRIHDRVTGAEVAMPSGQVQPGRLYFAPGDLALTCDGVPVVPGSYLIQHRSWTLRNEDNGTTTSGEPMRADADTTSGQVIFNLGRELRELDGKPVEQWAVRTPLMGGSELDQRLHLLRLDKALTETLPALRSACHRPVTRLRSVERFVPIGQVRQIVPRAIAELSARSQDWARMTPSGVRPARLLSPVRESDLDFYENRMLAQLVDGLWAHARNRLSDVERIFRLLREIGTYADAAGGRPWRDSQRLFHIIADLYEKSERNKQAQELSALFADLRDVLAGLRGPSILPGVRRDADLGSALRSTNVLTNDARYRQAADLRRVWVAESAGTEDPERPQQWCEAFTFYAGLLLVHALDLVGLETSGSLGRGRTLLMGDLAMDWDDADVFVLRCGTRTLLRVVPLAHPFTASRQAGPVGHEIDVLQAARPTARTLVLYPGENSERTVLPLDVRLRAFQGCEAPAPTISGRPLALLPVSPLEIDSVIRLARSLRWAIVRERVEAYPVRVMCDRKLANALAEGSEWLTATPDGLLLRRPPAPYELQDAVRRVESSAPLRVGTRGPAGIDQLRTDLTAAAFEASETTRCPLCHTPCADPIRAVRLRDNDTFATHCVSCDQAWEIRRCAGCSSPFPVLHTRKEPPAPAHGDTLDRTFGSEMLTSRCWIRPAATLCPLCSKCPEPSSATCNRCSPVPT
ncbi:hypothetical protein [Actinocorallia longicatena]